MKHLLRDKGLIIATHNAGKLKEIEALVKPLGIRCSSAVEHELSEPEETGMTFVENAMLKSRAAVQATGLPCLSDDSGLVIPALGGAPGIYSARWAIDGDRKDFNIAFERIQRELADAGAERDVECYFVCVLSLALPHAELSMISNDDSESYSLSIVQEEHVSFYNIEGRVYGSLSFPPRGDQGFGYDPIFIAEGMQQTFAELAPEEKHQISHRANAFQGLLKVIG